MSEWVYNKINAFCTESEWRELSKAVEKGEVDWVATTDGTFCSDYDREISFTTQRGAPLLSSGRMADLSASYPSVLFKYVAKFDSGGTYKNTWFCNGIENASGSKDEVATAKAIETERFVSAMPKEDSGIDHIIAVMPDGRVAADGENRFGECNIFSWNNIKEISCGNWHTVGLCADGTVLATGSNYNGQCDLSDIPEKAIAVSCGRYHTAILLESGKVIIKGTLEQDDHSSPQKKQKESSSKSDGFPRVIELGLNKYIKGWEQMNKYIEFVSEGDELILEAPNQTNNRNYDDEDEYDDEEYDEYDEEFDDDSENEDWLSVAVYTKDNNKIGYISLWPEAMKLDFSKDLKATVESVIPLSKRRKGSKYASMQIRIEFVGEEKSKKATNKDKQISNQGNTQINYRNWPPVVKIKSIYDSVVGLTDKGEIFIDGYCPLDAKEIEKIMLADDSTATQKVSDLTKLWSFRELWDKTLALTGYKGNEAHIIIPSEICNKKVSQLDDRFMSPSKDNISTLTRTFLTETFESVYIPKEIEIIGESAFEGCKNLKKIKFESDSIEIGESAFLDCDSLADENGFVIVSDLLYSYCGNDVDVKIPDGVSKIAENAFKFNEEIESVYIPDSVKVIGDYAFYDCDNLSMIRLSKNLKEIGNIPFAGCCLHTIEISGKRFDVETDILNDISEVYKSNDDECFLYSENDLLYAGNIVLGAMRKDLTTVTIKDGTKIIATKAFSHLENLTSVVLPETIETIGEFAFSLCWELESINIPDAVKKIDFHAFGGCRALTEIVLPEFLVSIGDGAFSGCPLTQITIPKNVYSIADSTFDDCSSLSEIHFLGASTQLGKYVFIKNKNISIYAPKDSYAEKYAKKNKMKFTEV